MMDVVLQGLPQVICYLDDILITGSSDEEHLANVERVLERLRKYGIRAKRSKCAFLRPSVEYLGHRVDATGLHTTRAKLKQYKKRLHPRMYKSSDPSLVWYILWEVLAQPFHITSTPKQAAEGRPHVGMVTRVHKSIPSCQGSPQLSTCAGPLRSLSAYHDGWGCFRVWHWSSNLPRVCQWGGTSVGLCIPHVVCQ